VNAKRVRDAYKRLETNTELRARLLATGMTHYTFRDVPSFAKMKPASSQEMYVRERTVDICKATSISLDEVADAIGQQRKMIEVFP
jgi:hypothetical protein